MSFFVILVVNWQKMLMWLRRLWRDVKMKLEVMLLTQQVLSLLCLLHLASRLFSVSVPS